MVRIKAFKGIRPRKDIADKLAAKPYDVLNSEEAREVVKDNPYSFLHVTKPEVDLPGSVDIHSQAVYDKAAENFDKFLSRGYLKQDDEEYLYIYRQRMGGNEQVGLVAISSIQDYFDDKIKKHEYTRPEKEQDRIDHMKAIGAHPGPVFMTYYDVEEINKIMKEQIENEPEYQFIADDGVGHTLWVIKDKGVTDRLVQLFKEQVPATYIADGHHRAASSAKVGQAMRDENGNDPEAAYNYFLTVLFPASELNIIDYNRVVKDLNGHTEEELLNLLKEKFVVEKAGSEPYKPLKPREFGMFLNSTWYKLSAKEGTYDDKDPVGTLDVSILQKNILDEILNIKDPRTDNRVDFVGGIRGLKELEKRVVSGEMKAAFALFPVTIQQLMTIADSGKVMPPKSTWFEPKLRSGLVVHKFR